MKALETYSDFNHIFDDVSNDNGADVPYKVKKFPVVYVIDANGKIAGAKCQGDKLRDVLDELVSN